MTTREVAIIRGTLGLANDGISGDLADLGVAETTDPFAEDIVIREAAGLPYGGDWKGKDGLRDLMTKIGSLAKLTPMDVYYKDTKAMVDFFDSHPR